MARNQKDPRAQFWSVVSSSLTTKVGWVLALLIPWCSAALATDYYVRTDGSDSNAGTGNTAALAWASPSKCATSTIKAGDRCLIQPGTYYLSSGVTQANSGAIKTDNVMSGCTCTAKSTTISCSAAVSGVAVGDWVRCDGTGPYFNWTRVSAINGSTITLQEGYRGTTSATATTLDAARFVEVIGDGTTGSVVITRTKPKPSGVTWTQSTTYPEVWSYLKSSASSDPVWSSPKSTPLNLWLDGEAKGLYHLAFSFNFEGVALAS